MDHSIALTLACGPYFSEHAIPASIFILLVIKPLTYFAFVQAFRFRVTRAVPMGPGQAVKIALARTLAGFVILGSIALAYQAISHEIVPPPVAWGALSAERLAIWAALGLGMAGLRGRRVVGWTLSGTAIDAAFDIAVTAGFMGAWSILGVIAGLLVVFLVPLTLIGRRTSLRARFDGMKCTNCMYDLTGNVSGQCPECGTPVPAA